MTYALNIVIINNQILIKRALTKYITVWYDIPINNFIQRGKLIVKISFIKHFNLILVAMIIFVIGFILGHLATKREWDSARKAQREMAIYLYDEIKNNFGSINEDNKNDLNIIGSIHLYKEASFEIILENNVKTIRVNDKIFH